MRYSLKYFAQSVSETLAEVKEWIDESNMTPKAWFQKRVSDGKSFTGLGEDAYYPVLVGSASAHMGRVSRLLGDRWTDLKKEIDEVLAKADAYDEIFDNLDDEEIRKLRVLMNRGDRYDREALMSAIHKGIDSVDEMEEQEAFTLVNSVFTEDEELPEERWTRGDDEELTLNRKDRTFTYSKGSESKTIKIHEMPNLIAEINAEVEAS